MPEGQRAAPSGLGVAGKRLWKDVANEYELREDELRLLEDACREVDIVARLQAAVDAGPLVVPGSRGQDTVHPALGEIRQHRLLLSRLLRQLQLPDDPVAEKWKTAQRSTSARKAALERWRRDGA